MEANNGASKRQIRAVSKGQGRHEYRKQSAGMQGLSNAVRQQCKRNGDDRVNLRRVFLKRSNSKAAEPTDRSANQRAGTHLPHDGGNGGHFEWPSHGNAGERGHQNECHWVVQSAFKFHYFPHATTQAFTCQNL